MTAVIVLPRSHEWTVDDLEHLPDDGLQYELIDGILLVSPAPMAPHQRAARAVFRLLDQACPPVDPAEPGIVGWDLIDGRYVEVGRATGDEELSVIRPFPLTLVPSRVAAG